MTLEQLSWHVDDVVKREVQGLKGVGRVERYGGVNREIKVALDPDRMLALGITASEVNQQLRLTNADFAGGRGDVGGQEQAIRTLAGAKTVEDAGRRPRSACRVAATCGSTKSPASTDSYEEPKSFARLNGEPVVASPIFRAKGASDVA